MAQRESISFMEFQKRFANEETCCQFLFDMRWPEGFFARVADKKSIILSPSAVSINVSRVIVRLLSLPERSFTRLIRHF